MGHASVKPAFVAQIQADARAELIAALTDIEDLSRNMNTTRQTLRDRLGALLRSNAQAEPTSVSAEPLTYVALATGYAAFKVSDRQPTTVAGMTRDGIGIVLSEARAGYYMERWRS